MKDEKCAICANPAMYIHAKCHITAPLFAMIEGNKLTLGCYECKKELATMTLTGLKGIDKNE